MLVIHDWLKEYIGESIPSAEKIAELLTFHAFEIEGIEKKGEHEVIDVDVLPNRSSDCLCHRGIAREIATLLDTTLVHDPLALDTIDLPTTELITVDIQDTSACRRFTAILIEGIEVKESPLWLQARLKALGQRPINNIVDATNYVMYSLGQPLHAYDAERFTQVDGMWHFQIRKAQKGEAVSLIAEGGKDEDRNVSLIGSELLIVDGSSNTPIGLAGVKGGKYAGVDTNTTKIIVEAANFDPILTRKTARGLGIVIDASKRFENELSSDLPPYAQVEVVELIKKIAGGKCAGYVDVYPTKVVATTVTVSPERANALLGTEISTAEMSTILSRAGIHCIQSGVNLVCTGPWERTDLHIEEDFIEEIGRIYGYDRTVSVVPDTVPLLEFNARHYYSEKVRKQLVILGFSEVITSSFCKKDKIQLHNALASDKSYLRSSLVKNIIEVLDKNVGHVDLLGAEDTRVFEIGTVFQKTETGVEEHVSLCIGVRIKQSGYSGKEDVVISEIVTLLEETLGVTLSVKSEKGIIEINFTAVFTTLPAPTAYEPIEVAKEISYKPFSLYPAISRDIAVWVTEGTNPNQVEQILNTYSGPLRVRTTLFDEFTKEGRTSYAFRMVFQSKEKTLTDGEINVIMDLVYAEVVKSGWEVR